MTMRRNFNMVEVLLAVVVIAVGLSSVFVLFPVGLTAHKTAAADNSIADLAEYVFSTVKSQVDIESSGDTGGATPTKKFETGFWAGCEKIAETDMDGSGLDVSTAANWAPVGFDRNSGDKNKASLLQNTGKKNVFWIRQLSGPASDPYVDFSAIAQVYVDRDDSNSGLEDEYYLENVKNFPSDKPRRFILPLVLEISYPAETPYARREKKYFRFEIFNENYEPSPATP